MSVDHPADERAKAYLDCARQLAADLRRDPGRVHRILADLPRHDLEAVASVLMALVPPGPVDAWWQRSDLDDVFAQRRAVLIGREVAA